MLGLTNKNNSKQTSLFHKNPSTIVIPFNFITQFWIEPQQLASWLLIPWLASSVIFCLTFTVKVISQNWPLKSDQRLHETEGINLTAAWKWKYPHLAINYASPWLLLQFYNALNIFCRDSPMLVPHSSHSQPYNAKQTNSYKIQRPCLQ